MCPLNMTVSELERHAYITGDPQARLLADLADRLDDAAEADGVRAYVEEARGCYPDEDILSGVTAKLRDFAKRLRGQNREDLLCIADEFDDIQNEINQQSEYGADELRKALDALPI